MSFHGPLRAGLYSALLIFSVILLGLTAARVHHTESLGRPDTIFGGRTGYYEPSTVELLSTSILATLFSLPLMACLCSRRGFGLPHFMAELLGILSLFILYLVGSAIFTHKYRRVSYCRGFFKQCRIVTAIMAFSWMNWIITLFLLLAALAALFHFRSHGRDTYEHDGRRHHRGAEAAAATGAAGAAYATQDREKHSGNHGVGSTTASAGTGALAGGAAGHHGHHAGYDDTKATTGAGGYGTGTTGTGTNYGTTGTDYGTGTGTHHGAGGYNAPQTRGVDSSGPVSTGYNTSTV